MPAAVQTALWLLGVAVVGSGLPLEPRITEAEWASYYNRDVMGPGTYAFGYDVEDPVTGNVQFRREERHLNGTVTGSYGLMEPDGNVKIVHYTADEAGYRVTIENSLTGTVYYPPLVNVPLPTEQPVFNPGPPVYQPEQPVYQPEQPVYQPEQPVYQPEQPVYQPEQPVYLPEQPVYQPQQPVYQPEQPSYPQQAPILSSPLTPPGPPIYIPQGSKSPQLASAIGSSSTLGQPVYEEHTPPKYSWPRASLKGSAFEHLHSRMNFRHNIPALDDDFNHY